MARRINYKPYFFLAGFLVLILSFSKREAEKMRILAISCIAPSWKTIDLLKCSLLSFLTLPPLKGAGAAVKEEIEKLSLENLAMKSQIENLRSYLLFEDRLEDQWQRYKELSKREDSELFWKDFFSRRSENLCENLRLQYQALPAKVIFREPVSWSGSVWLNVGEKENQSLGRTIVAKNSPVVSGNCIIGLIEEVSEHKCRLRLITDPDLVCSVRALRGGAQDRLLMQQIDALVSHLNLREDLWKEHSSQKEMMMQQLITLKSHLNPEAKEEYMAKGELCGTGGALWRSHSGVLKGVGFNYDFADEEGPARDLRTGHPIDSLLTTLPAYLLKIGDLLVTTGMDGIFPRDFKVAVVTKILPLREGGCSYEIEAQSIVENIQEIKEVFILPPIAIESNL
ncbi:MAG TPA: rod shape-determining protein MreC [Rhabdochlamydiaceae bacterium]|nr:rod shape-determining protein MreC [Rhabdochlamydiaceae bacterium]